MKALRDRRSDPIDAEVRRTVPTWRRSRSISPFHQIKAFFLIAAFASLGLSVTLWFTGSRDEGVFVGLWVPAIHSLGALVLTSERKPLERGHS